MELHKATDKELVRLEKELKKIYQTAYNEIKKDMQISLAKMELSNAGGKENLAEAYKYDRLKKLEEQIAKTLQESDKEATRVINAKMRGVYQLNYNGTAEELQFATLRKDLIAKILNKESNPFTMIAESSIKDLPTKLAALQGEFTTALLKGESIPNMAKRIKQYVEKNDLYKSVRIARTETTRVENQAKQDVANKGEKLGFKMYKQWVATLDDRTRDDHLEMNGIEVPADEPFTLPDGSQVMFPGDSSLGADASEVINCRCTMIDVIKEE